MSRRKVVKKTTKKLRSTRFEPGNKRGNRFGKGNKAAVGKGRPKKIPSLDSMLADILGTDTDDQKKAVAHQILTAVAKKARRGDSKAASLILDRTWGRAKQFVEVDVDAISRKDIASLFPAVAPPGK